MLKIEFKTSNAAFCDYDGEENDFAKREETKRVLMRIMEDLEYGKTHGYCIDINGNKIGNWTLD